MYIEEASDPVAIRLERIRAVTQHLGTDAVDLVILNTAPTALAGRVLQSRRLIVDKDPCSGRFVDRGLVRRNLAELAKYVTPASEYRHRSVDGYRGDWKAHRRSNVQVAIEACVDVASHVLADPSLRPPSMYAETFEILVEAGLMSPGLGRVMVEMTGSRNILVHEYARIDAEVVIRILQNRLDGFHRFEAEALGWV